jgi:hypothetical protein
VEMLCAHCFNGCSNLSAVTLEFGSQISRIESSAFSGCSKLSSICIQSPITDFPVGCFNGCSQLSITQVDPDSASDSGDAHSRFPGAQTQNAGRPHDSDGHLEPAGQDN